MRKKLLSGTLSIFLAVVLILPATAFAYGSGPIYDLDQRCPYCPCSSAWISSQNGCVITYECANCYGKFTRGTHTGGTATCTTQAICTSCGKSYGEFAEHTYGTEWLSDDDNHWHACTECGETADEAGHDDADDDHLCDECGYVVSAHSLSHFPRIDATAVSEGNVEYWYCSICQNYFLDEECTEMTTDTDIVIPRLAPSIIAGDGQTVTVGEENELSFTSDAPFDEFVSVEINGVALDENNYITSSGSIMVTLTSDYVASLSKGEYTLGIVSETGIATAHFTVNEKVIEETEKTPETLPETDNTATDPNTANVNAAAAADTAPAASTPAATATGVQTGDDNHMVTSFAAMGIGALAIAAVLLKKKHPAHR